MNKLKLSVAFGLMLASAAALAESPQEASIKKLIQPRLGDGAAVDSVTKTPYSALFEVRVGSEIFYTDAQAKYLFVGRILDANTTEDYTKARVDELSKIKFSDLPFESALKTVKGNGKRVIAVFEDPNCGYCKRFERDLQKVDNVTIHMFLIPILGRDSPEGDDDQHVPSKHGHELRLVSKTCNSDPSAAPVAPSPSSLSAPGSWAATGAP